MLVVQGKDYSNITEVADVALVRTYKGEIERTQAGKISTFPVSFITVGLTLQFLGRRDEILELEQIFLSADAVQIRFPFKSSEDDLIGMFSATGTARTEIRDRDNRSLRLSVSLVSVGTDITRYDGTKFVIKKDNVQVASNCVFGKVQLVTGNNLRLVGGPKIPLSYNDASKSSVLVLGDVELETISS